MTDLKHETNTKSTKTFKMLIKNKHPCSPQNSLSISSQIADTVCVIFLPYAERYALETLTRRKNQICLFKSFSLWVFEKRERQSFNCLSFFGVSSFAQKCIHVTDTQKDQKIRHFCALHNESVAWMRFSLIYKKFL